MTRNGSLSFSRIRYRRLYHEDTYSRFIGIILLSSVACGLIFITALFLADFQDNTAVPKMLIIVNRHGARNPLRHYTFENIEWDGALGQLTTVGMQQAFEFGKELSWRYYWKSSRVSTAPESFKIYANYIHRTQETAKGIILGIVYGMTRTPDHLKGNCSCHSSNSAATYSCIKECLGLQINDWNEKRLPDIEVLEEKSEKLGLLLQFEKCKGWLERTAAQNEQLDLYTKSRELFDTQYSMLYKLIRGDELCLDKSDISQEDDQSVPLKCKKLDLNMLEDIWGNTVCALAAGQSNFTEPFVPEHLVASLEIPVTWKWHKQFTAENAHYSGGILINEILESIVTVITKERKRQLGRKNAYHQGFKTLIFSGHDTTLASLLPVLGIEHWHYPGFLSHITFLVKGPVRSEKISEHWLEIMYDDDFPKLHYCNEEMCPLSMFIDQMEHVRMPMNYCEPI